MAKPQQSELRRSGAVPALDPDATEAVLSAEDRPKTSTSRSKIPEDQQPGHHPDDEQDKPPMDKFAERLGIVPEGEEPDDAPHVEDMPAAAKLAASFDDPDDEPGSEIRTPPVKLLLLGPALTYVGARAVYRTVVGIIRR